MTDVEAMVRAQSQMFQSELPELLKELPGQWVVYLDGVQYWANGQNEAYVWALTTYGIDGGFVIAQVIEPKTLHVSQLGSAGWIFAKQEYDELKAKYDALESECKRLRVIANKARWFCEPRDAIRALLAINRYAFDELVNALDAPE